MRYFLFRGDSYVDPVLCRSSNVHSWNVHDPNREPLQWAKVKYICANRKANATSYLLTVALFTRSVSVCEIIAYWFPNVIVSNHLSLKWRSMKQTMKIDEWTHFTNMHLSAKISASRSSRLFPVNFVINGRTYTRQWFSNVCRLPSRPVV